MPPRVSYRARLLDPDAPSRRHHLALAAAAGGGVALLGAFVARLGADEHWPLDHSLRAALATHRIPGLRPTLHVAGLAGSAVIYVPATLLATALIARKTGDLDRAMPLVGAVAGAAVASLGLKRLVRRPRPHSGSGPRNERPSFPSGHATRASAAALMIAYILVRERMAPRRVAMPLAIATAVATGISRAYADAHWTTDVVGGLALGSASAALAAMWYELSRMADT